MDDIWLLVLQCHIWHSAFQTRCFIVVWHNIICLAGELNLSCDLSVLFASLVTQQEWGNNLANQREKTKKKNKWLKFCTSSTNFMSKPIMWSSKRKCMTIGTTASRKRTKTDQANSSFMKMSFLKFDVLLLSWMIQKQVGCVIIWLPVMRMMQFAWITSMLGPMNEATSQSTTTWLICHIWGDWVCLLLASQFCNC